MDDIIVEARFTDLGTARRALHHLKRLDREGRLRVRDAALVQRSGQGEIGLPGESENADGVSIPADGMARAVVDVLRGPVGTLFAWPAETFRGSAATASLRREGDREVALEEISRSLEPGVTLVVAEIAEADPEVLDAALDGLGGTVTTRAARDLHAEVAAADEAASAAVVEGRRVLRERRSEAG